MQFEGVLNADLSQAEAQLVDVRNKYQHLLKAAKYTVFHSYEPATELMKCFQYGCVCMLTKVGLPTGQNGQLPRAPDLQEPKGSRFSMWKIVIFLITKCVY